MNTLKKVLLVSATAVLFASSAWAETLDQIVQRMNDRYAAISSIHADFVQEFKSASGDSPQRSAGKVWFKKPGKMRWVYGMPVKDELVSDGRRIWFYQPDLKQAVERPFDPVQNLGGDFLTGVGNIKRDFMVRLAEEKPFSWVLELTPKAMHPNIQRLFIEINRADALIAGSMVEDRFGNATEISYRSIRVNEAISDSFFTFSPPKGVKVVR